MNKKKEHNSNSRKYVLRVVINSISNHLEEKNIIPQDNFLDIGGDSLSAMKVKIDIEEKLNTNIPLEEIILSDSINDLVNYITKSGESDG
ncbi:acyl carrier protein [Staphylococcus epidermidis]|nr:acyl carrier protein [Staphylococcus epidermidis]MBM6078045.1 acyl carrier protein [Staphylococcus epidermidis]MBM6082618.1 acyl carrier protein [Staphylococcus epidermidis]QRT38556.1 acyl carrier protein [Staphylococcus epidermidis]